VSADFRTSTDGGVADGLDLDDLGADSAGMLRRPGVEDDMAAEWPSDLPGLWKGTKVSQVKHVARVTGRDSEGARGGSGGDVREVPMYTQIIEGYAPNPWLLLDPKDQTKIISSNIMWGYFSEAPEMFTTDAARAGILQRGDGDAARAGVNNVYFNRAFKYTAGDKHPGGRKRWCNNYVVRDDGKQMFMLSNSGPGEANAPPPVCPAAPDPKQLENTGINRADEPTASGAVFADVMMKL
jgi:hypothetical protein